MVTDLSPWLNRPYFTTLEAAYLLDGQLPANTRDRLYVHPAGVVSWRSILFNVINNGEIEPYYPTNEDKRCKFAHIQREALFEFARQHGIKHLCAEAEEKIPNKSVTPIYQIMAALWLCGDYGDNQVSDEDIEKFAALAEMKGYPLPKEDSTIKGHIKKAVENYSKPK